MLLQRRYNDIPSTLSRHTKSTAVIVIVFNFCASMTFGCSVSVNWHAGDDMILAAHSLASSTGLQLKLSNLGRIVQLSEFV